MKRCFFFWVLLLPFITSCGEFNVFSPDTDVSLGEAAHKSILSDTINNPILDSVAYPEIYRYVDSIKQVVLSSPEIMHRKEFKWKLTILKNDSIVNAFCSPGGFIYVYTGLLKFLNAEDQLAGVIGHEIAHADLRHSTRQLSKSAGIKAVLYLIGIEDGGLVETAEGLLDLKFSRSHETEADIASVKYLCNSEYDPRGVSYFFKLMEEKGETSGVFQFLSTHPNPDKREEKIFSTWESNGKKQGLHFEDRYKERIKALP